MRLIIFGGTFDPPHNGHVEILNSLKHYEDDRIIVLPNYLPPHKSANATSQDRLNMCRLAFPDYEISDYEINKGGKSYTYQTLQYFKDQYNLDQDSLLYVIGADSMRDLKTWNSPQKLAELATFYVIKRPHYQNTGQDIEEFKKLYGGKIILSDIIGQDISSTEIRLRNAFDSIDDFVPKDVAQYIKQNCLYNRYKVITDMYPKLNLPKKRIAHILSVALTALKLGYIYKADSESVILAALFHDIGKSLNLKKAYELGLNITHYTIELPAVCRHADFGAEIARKYFGIKDEDILNAIKYHTTARADMSLLEKIIFLADYIEPTRTTPGLEPIVQTAQYDIDKAVFMTIKKTMDYLTSQNFEITPAMKSAYEFYFKEITSGV